MVSASENTELVDSHATTATLFDNSNFMSSLKEIIDDDEYKQLKKSLVRKGRGRPCEISQVSGLTNRLLLQLFFLKEEDNSPFRQVEEWLHKLIPQSVTVSWNWLYKRMQEAIKTCASYSTPEDIFSFLKEELDFQDLPDPLSSLGLTLSQLQKEPPYHRRPLDYVRNEIVLELEKLRIQLCKTHSFVVNWLKQLSISCKPFTYYQLKRKVDKCISEYKILSKRKNKSTVSLQNFDDFLKLPFCKDVTGTMVLIDDKCNNCEILMKEMNVKDFMVKKLENDNLDLKSQLEIQNQIVVELNAEKINLEIKQSCFKDSNLELEKKLREEKVKNDILLKEIEEHKKSKLYQQNYAPKKNLEEVMVERDTLLKEKETDNEKLISISESMSLLKKKLKTEQTTKYKLKAAFQKSSEMCSDLSNMLENEKENVKLREGEKSNRFLDSVRHTYYALQGQGNVAASNCSNVIATVSKHLFNTDFTEQDLPSKSSSINFSHEANVIAQHHVVDEIINSDHFMFASDGTSRQKAHYIEQHVQLSNGKLLSLGFSEIACNDSDTLLEKCVNVFKNMCEIYCLDDEELNMCSLFKEVIRKLKCIMSDRASVMKSFDKKMAAFKCDILGDEDCSTHFIFCNAHFLLALSSAAEDALSSVERGWKENGVKLGRDANSAYFSFEKNTESAAIRAIRMAAECLGPRGDEKSGCRQEWLAHCSGNKTVSKFTSYRSNRFNNLFQNAAALLLHKNDIESFLNDYVSHSNLKLQSVLADIRDTKILSNIIALAFFNVFFTEPYWKLMNSKKSYVHFPEYVKLMDDTLNLWCDDCFDHINAVSVFPDFKSNDNDVEMINNVLLSDDFDKCIFCSTLQEIIWKML